MGWGDRALRWGQGLSLAPVLGSAPVSAHDLWSDCGQVNLGGTEKDPPQDRPVPVG